MTQELLPPPPSLPEPLSSAARSPAQYRRRIAELAIEAEAQRLAFGLLTDSYLRATHPFDRFYTRATHMVRSRPLATTALLGLGGIATIMIGRRLPRLPLRGLIRGVTVATFIMRSLRR